MRVRVHLLNFCVARANENPQVHTPDLSYMRLTSSFAEAQRVAIRHEESKS